MVFAHGVGKSQAKHLGVEGRGLGGIAAAKGSVVKFFAQHGVSLES
jgi:hypothetical protein